MKIELLEKMSLSTDDKNTYSLANGAKPSQLEIVNPSENSVEKMGMIETSQCHNQIKYTSIMKIPYLYLGNTISFYWPYSKIPPNAPLKSPPFSIGPQCK